MCRKDLRTTIGCKIHMHDDFLLSFLVKLVALIILLLHYSLSSIICLSLHCTIESSLKFKSFYACQINGVSSLSISPFLGKISCRGDIVWFPKIDAIFVQRLREMTWCYHQSWILSISMIIEIYI